MGPKISALGRSIWVWLCDPIYGFPLRLPKGYPEKPHTHTFYPEANGPMTPRAMGNQAPVECPAEVQQNSNPAEHVPPAQQLSLRAEKKCPGSDQGLYPWDSESLFALTPAAKAEGSGLGLDFERDCSQLGPGSDAYDHIF